MKARAHFEESVLVIQAKGHWFTIQGDRLSLKTGGFDGRQWLLSWYTPSGLATAMLQGDDAVDAFIELAPPAISEELKRARRAHSKRGWGFHLGMALLALFVLVPVLALGLFWVFGDEVSQWAADRVSQEQKDRLGALAFEQIRPSLKLVERGEVRETVEFIGVRVTTGSRNRYVFHVADAPEVNAFALPGGHVVVYTGLLRATQSANELAAVLAHEASHVEKRHTLRNLIHTLGWRAVLAAALGDFSSGIWGDMAAQLGSMSYSRDLEREADSEALIMLRRAGVSPNGLLSFFERMAEHETADPGIWATHPASQERIAAIRKQTALLAPYPSRPITVDWPRFERALSHLPVN
jgi:Zn-dependent protease with chaperone function